MGSIINVKQPEFNLRSRLNELDYDTIPYEKMPLGSVIQVEKTAGLHTGSISTTSASFQPVNHLVVSFEPHFQNSLIRIDVSVQYFFHNDWNNSGNYAVFTVYRNGGINLADNAYTEQSTTTTYNGNSGTVGAWFAAQAPFANYNHTANFTLWDIPHTTQTSQYKLYYRMHTTGGTRRLYTGWNSHNDSIAVSEIKQ